MLAQNIIIFKIRNKSSFITQDNCYTLENSYYEIPFFIYSSTSKFDIHI